MPGLGSRLMPAAGAAGSVAEASCWPAIGRFGAPQLTTERFGAAVGGIKDGLFAGGGTVGLDVLLAGKDPADWLLLRRSPQSMGRPVRHLSPTRIAYWAVCARNGHGYNVTTSVMFVWMGTQCAVRACIDVWRSGAGSGGL